MANQRKPGLIHIGAWLKSDLDDDLQLITRFNQTNKSRAVVEILEREVYTEQLRSLLAEMRKLTAENRSTARLAKRMALPVSTHP